MRLFHAAKLLCAPGGPLLRLAAPLFLVFCISAANAIADGLRHPETVRARVAAVRPAPLRSGPVTLRPPFEEPRIVRPVSDRNASNVSHESNVTYKSTPPALTVNTSRGVPTNPLVVEQFRGIINQSFATRDNFIRSGDPMKLAEGKRRQERSHALLIELIDLGYAPWLVAGWCDDLFADQIVPGMPLDLVEAYWGDPLYIQTSGPEEILTYPFGNLYRQVILVEGCVTEVRTVSSIADS
ncbi:MAG: hypothetical protein WB586_02065 [Chthoniobacterales bacterium]